MGMAAISAAAVMFVTMLMMMFSAGMIAIMMTAPCVGIKIEFFRQEILYCLICAAGNAAIDRNARCVQCLTGAAANAAADQRIHMMPAQDFRQRAMAAALGIDHHA